MNTLDKIKIMQAYLDGHKIVARGKDDPYTATYHISDSQEPRWNFVACDYIALPKERWAVMATDKRSGATYMIFNQTYDTKEAAKDMADKRSVTGAAAYYTVVKVTE